MQASLNLSEREKNRLIALRKLNVLDSPFETLFDGIAKAASEICKTPIALISLVDEHRQWFKANYGLTGVTDTPREFSFCQQTILSNELMEVKDATKDERFKDNPLVKASPQIRFYAGAPITLPLGENIGSLCVIDTKENMLDENQKVALVSLARIISQCLVMRQNNHKVWDSITLT